MDPLPSEGLVETDIVAHVNGTPGGPTVHTFNYRMLGRGASHAPAMVASKSQRNKQILKDGTHIPSEYHPIHQVSS